MKRRFLISLIFILLTFPNFKLLYSFGKEKNAILENSFRVMSYNARHFNRYQTWIKEPNIYAKIEDLVKKQNPDILFFQEFEVSLSQYHGYYPYYHFVTKYEDEETYQTHCAIFSNYPIITKGIIEFPKSRHNALFADLKIGKDTIRVYNFHLESFHISGVEPSQDELKRDQQIKEVKGFFKKGITKQHEQIKILKSHAQNCKYPILMAGDMNYTPFGSQYHELSNGFKDTFSESGKGFGNSYLFHKIPLRIDYIFYDEENFESFNHKVIPKYYSDHYALVSDLVLKQ